MTDKRTDATEAQTHRWLTALLATLLLAFVFNAATTVTGVVTGTGVVYAQSDAPAAAVDTSAITPDQVNAIAREIWCPLCSGVRLDACELKACEQMKEVIAIKLAEGEDLESIRDYFVEQYGPQVLGEPPRSGFNWLAWILPVVAVVVGGFFFWRNTQRMMQPAAATHANLAQEPTGKPMTRAAKATSNPGEGDDDDYTQKLEEELAKYG